jgi:periplasmic protein CpxP/Spy
MKLTNFRILALVAALLLGAGILLAQGMHGRGGPDAMFNGMLSHYADALDLSSAQQDQIKAIWEKEKPTLKPLMQQMRQNRAATEALVENAPFDEAKTQALASQHAQTSVALEVEHARMKSEMLAVLTPDQKTKYQQLEAQHQARWSHSASSAPPAD